MKKSNQNFEKENKILDIVLNSLDKLENICREVGSDLIKAATYEATKKINHIILKNKLLLKNKLNKKRKNEEIQNDNEK